MENIQQQVHELYIPPPIFLFLKTHTEAALSSFRNAFQENIHFTLTENEQIRIKCSQKSFDKLGIILMAEPVVLSHSSEIKAWLTKNSTSWFSFCNSLIKEYLCAILTERDFSQTYIFVAPHHEKIMYAAITDFLSQDTIGGATRSAEKSEETVLITLYKPFADYLMNYEDFKTSLMEEDSEEEEAKGFSSFMFARISIKKTILKIMKPRLGIVTSQGCFLDEFQARIFKEIKDEILSDIQMDYQVIGNEFQSDTSMMSLSVTDRTNLICIACSEPDSCLLDNFIHLETNALPNTENEYSVAKDLPSGHKIWTVETWNLPFNQKFYVNFSTDEEQKNDFKIILKECFKILDDNNNFSSKTTGIYLPIKTRDLMNKFCTDLIAVIHLLDKTRPTDFSIKFIAVVVDTADIQEKMMRTISELNKIETEVKKGAIFKTSLEIQQDDHIRKFPLLVQLSDFSCTSVNLKLAIDALMEKLTKENHSAMNSDMVQIHRNKVESLLFFFEKNILESVPNIKDFLLNSNDDILMIKPANPEDKIKKTFKHLLKKIIKKRVSIQETKTEHLNCVMKRCQIKFPNVKCTYIKQRSYFFIEGLKIEDIVKTEKEINQHLSLLLNKERLEPEDMPVNIQENAVANSTSEDSFNAENFFNIQVLKTDIFLIDAEAIVCPVSDSITQKPHLCELVLNHAGIKVEEELIACYEQYPDAMLPEGEVVFTLSGKLDYKIIIYVNWPKYDNSDIQKQLTAAMCNLLIVAEEHHLKSLAFTLLDSGSSNVKLKLKVKSFLDGLTYFLKQSSLQHLQRIFLVDNQALKCLQIMSLLTFHKVSFQHNMESWNNIMKTKRPKPIENLQLVTQCPICSNVIDNDSVKFDNCHHEYCNECLISWIEIMGQNCPLCLYMNPQPPGKMFVKRLKKSLPGYEGYHTFIITYEIPDGIQQDLHPNPGKPYQGTTRSAYLPTSEVGLLVLKMLQKAFKNHLIFNVGKSLTSKKSDVVVWTGILHKTSKHGGPRVYGYPDPHYLDYVIAQLMDIGITPESVSSNELETEIKLTTSL